MSPEAVTFERIFLRLKRAIVQGQFRPGDIMVTVQVAREFGASITPVRDAMQRLAAERLVRALPAGGFQVAILSQDALGNLYRWHGEILLLAAKNDAGVIQLGDLPFDWDQIAENDSETIVSLTATIFEWVGMKSGNTEHLIAIKSAGERLFETRLRETMLVNRVAEIRALWSAVRRSDVVEFVRLLKKYHGRRMRVVADLASN